MSVQALSWAWAQTTGSPTQKAVLVTLANRHNNDTGKCCPRIKLLAAETEFSERAVRGALSTLEEQGFITRHRSHKQDGTLGVYNYTLNMESRAKPAASLAATPPAPGAAQEPEVSLEPSEANASANGRISKQAQTEELWGACETYVQTPPTAKSPRSAYAKLVRELVEAGWTPQDVETRAEAYRKHPTFSKCELTLAALAKWGETFHTETQTREKRMEAIYRKAGMT